jgi:hypothetical protein
VTLGIEIKVWRGLQQIDRYLARLDLATGWLVIFDRRRNALPIETRVRSEIRQTEMGRLIDIIYA